MQSNRAEDDAAATKTSDRAAANKFEETAEELVKQMKPQTVKAESNGSALAGPQTSATEKRRQIKKLKKTRREKQTSGDRTEHTVAKWKQTNTANKLQRHERHRKATTKGKQVFAASDSKRNTLKSYSAHGGAKMTGDAKPSVLHTPDLRSHPLPTTQSPCSPAAPAGSPYHCSISSGNRKRPKCLLPQGGCNDD